MSKKLVIFDLDGTLAESKSDITPEMVEVLRKLSENSKIAIISGCNFSQMANQFFKKLGSFSFDNLRNVYMLPTSGGEMWIWDGPEAGCFQIYSHDLNLRQKVRIYNVFEQLYRTELMFCDYRWGEIAEDRRSQVTFSLLGQSAPLSEKETFDPKGFNRKKLAKAMQELLPEFEIRVGGTTSIDVTMPGVNKAYGIEKLLQYIQKHDINCLEHEYECPGWDESVGKLSCNEDITIDDAIYIGDALYEGGNDAIVKTTGIECVETSGPDETIEIIKSLLPVA